MRRFFLLLLLTAILAFQPDLTTTAQETNAITIIERTPQPDAVDIHSDTTLTVVFSAPVVPLTGTADLAALPAPVRISPAVDGVGEWLNTIVWQFTPTDAFPPGTTITVTTDEDFETVSGAPLTADQWQFTTQLARVSSIGLNTLSNRQYTDRENPRLYLDDALSIGFSQQVNKKTIEPLIHLKDSAGQDVPVTFRWERNSIVELKPINLLQIDSSYTLVVESSLDGQQFLTEPFSQIIHTIPYPSVASVSPEPDQEVGPTSRQRAAITFATEMDLNSLEGLIRIEPDDVVWQPETTSNNKTFISLEFEATILQTYTITLAAGARDIYGNTIDSDYTWSFTAVEPPPPSTNVYLLTRDQLNVTNAYRPNDTRMAMAVSGIEDFTGNFALYRARDLNTAISDLVMSDDLIQFPQRTAWERLLMPESPWREWQQTFNGGGSPRTLAEVLLAGEDGGQLDLGLYILEAEEYRSRYQQEPEITTRSTMLAVSTAILTVRRTPTDMLVWVTDMQNGAPLANVQVTRYSLDGTSEVATTDSDGLARLPTPVVDPTHCQPREWSSSYCSQTSYTFITAEAPEVYGIWYSDQAAAENSRVGYLYTDRRVYLPGDTVYFRGILRDKNDMDYTVPTESEVTLRVCYYYAQCDDSDDLQSLTVPVSYWGTIHGSFTLPADSDPMQYGIKVEWGDYDFTVNNCYLYSIHDFYCYDYPSNGTVFTVANFIIPEFEVNATPNAPEGIQGDSLGVTVNAGLYSGSPLRGGIVSWAVDLIPTSFSYERYRFRDATLDNDGDFFESSMQEGDPLTTGDDGSAVIPTDELGIPNMLVRANMGVAVTQGPESQNTRVSFLLHPAAFYVGLRHETGIATLEQPTSVEVVTVTPDRRLVSGQTVAYTVEHLIQEQRETAQYGHYYWETVVTHVGSGEVTTRDDGRAVIVLTPELAGIYRVRAVVTDEQGRSHSSTVEIRAGQVPLSVVRQPSYYDNPFVILSDQEQYVSGDTARLTIQTPGSGTLLLTVQRQNVQHAFVLPIESGEPILFDLPLGFEDAPNVYISGTFVQGMPSPHESPFYASAKLNLMVRPSHRELSVEVAPSTTQAQPGDSVTFTVRVTDRRGVPVRAEVGLALVDDATLSLLPSASLTLLETFYDQQPDRVYSGISLRGLIDDVTDRLDELGMGGGGGGGIDPASADFDPRDDYQITPLWLPNVMTDENGQATASVVLPDNLTRWNLDVRVVSLNTSVGQTELDIISTLPFSVRPQTPRFLVVGDTVELAMSVHNDTDTAHTVTAVIQAEGVTLFSDAEQTVMLPPFSQQRVAWRAEVDDVDAVSVTFAAGNDQVSDAARPDLPDNLIPVLAYSAPDTTATAGVLDEAGEVVEVISPPTDALTRELRVSLAPSLVDSVALARDAYPPHEHEPIDRVIARLMFNTALYELKSDPALADFIEQDIERLDRRRINTQWAWLFNQSDGNLYLTAYAMIALQRAERAGFTTAAPLVDAVCEAWTWNLNDQALRATNSNVEFERRVVSTHLWGLCGQYDPTILANLFDYRDRLSDAYKSLLLLTLHTAQMDSAQTLADELLAGATLSATGMHWQGENSGLWDTHAVTTALAIRSLTVTDPDHPLLPNAVRWLTTARRGRLWSMPLETAWSATALLDYARASGEQSPTYSASLALDGEAIHPNAALTADEEFMLPLDDGSHALRIERGDGNGVLYYTATLDATLNAAETPTVSRGITVMREYLDTDGNPVESVALGQTVLIRLTVTTTQPVNYFVLEDTLPAGLFSDDPSKISRTAEYNPRRWFYNWNDVRGYATDSTVQFSPPIRDPGLYMLTYEARAIAVGEFQTMPTHAYSAMTPDVFGRSDGRWFTVTAP